MTAAVTYGNYLERVLPNWFSKLPVIESKSEKKEGNWSYAKLWKTDHEGNRPPEKSTYLIENSTGDLYGIFHNNCLGSDEKLYNISLKAAGIFLMTPAYTLGMMAASVCKILMHISSIYWKIIPHVISIYRNFGLAASSTTLLMSVVWEIPHKILTNVFRVVRSPLYAIGLMFSAIVTIVHPLEGHKWMALIEYEWHERTSYRMDIRYRRTSEQINNLSLQDFIRDIVAGKLIYLTYCMQKKGNINDKSGKISRFEYPYL